MRSSIRSLHVAVAAVAVVCTTPAGAQLYGISFAGSDGPSTLHTISMADGTATAIGAVGFERCSGMDFGSTGVLYAACERSDGSNTPVLVTIDVATGAGTEIGPHGFTGAIADLSVRGSDGVLFAYDANNDPDHSLLTLDVGTGAGTLVGDTGLSFAGGNGMTFDLAGVLFQSQFSVGPSPDLNTLDASTGSATFIGQITTETGRLAAMDVDPASGVIFAILNEGSSGGGPSSLVTLDPTTQTTSSIGVTTSGMDAIAFASGGAGPVNPLEIPTLDRLGLAGLALLLMVAGATVIARR